MFDKEYYLKKYQEENDPKLKEQLDKLSKEYYQEYLEHKKIYKKAEKEYYEKYRKYYKGSIRSGDKESKTKRKRLGFYPLNKYHEEYDGHHISENFIVYIPSEIHKSIWHNIWTWQGMDAINELAMEFL